MSPTRNVISGHNLINIIYEDDIVLIAETERTLQALRQNVMEESEKKEQTINCGKTKIMTVRKKNNPRYQIRIGDQSQASKRKENAALKPETALE